MGGELAQYFLMFLAVCVNTEFVKCKLSREKEKVNVRACEAFSDIFWFLKESMCLAKPCINYYAICQT